MPGRTYGHRRDRRAPRAIAAQLTTPPSVRLALWIAVGLAIALTLLVHLLAAGVSHAAGIIYQYTQQDGTVVYTEQWDQIPAASRDMVRSLDGDTLEPIASTAAAAQAVAQPAPPIKRATRPAPPQESWGVIAQHLSPVLERLQAMNLSMPSQTQLGIGLTMFAFIAAMFSILRMTENRVAKAGIKFVLTVMVAGTVYSLFLTDMAQRFVTQEHVSSQNAAPDRASHTAIPRPSDRIGNPLSSLTHSIQETHDTSVEKAKQATAAMNQANRQREQTIAEVEPDSTTAGADSAAPAGGAHVSPQAAPPGTKPAQPQQAHEAIVHRVRDAAGQINQTYREVERATATIEGR